MKRQELEPSTLLVLKCGLNKILISDETSGVTDETYDAIDENLMQQVNNLTDHSSIATGDSSVWKKSKKLGLFYSFQRFTHPLQQVDVTATAEEHNITVDNPSTASKDEEKVEPVLVAVVLKERHIRVYDLMSRRRHFGPSSEIQKLVKILPTYLDMSGFLDQNIHTDWSTIEAYRGKMANPFAVQYVDGIAQQTIGSLDCGPFVAAYAKYLSDGLQVPNDGLDARLLHKRYAALLWKYGEAKAQKPYATDVKDPGRPKSKSVAPMKNNLSILIRSL
ncbi:hypothetical protein CQW23_01802 [Capsicum baccatum]|uniref:Ubiquitin-like protease family profile domain-containing protein n=1 Tax=Capsicum baccatum TaxID=33114 RepID=A0A2G2XPR8_CAPBA|nr:hypothetical protein CQW23_01802 [Capsicum baccatum]